MAEFSKQYCEIYDEGFPCGDIELFLPDPKDETKYARVDYKKYISLHKSKIQNNG